MNEPTPTSKIEIGGQTYTLAFDFNAMAIIQEETGRNPFSQDFWKDIGPVELIALYYGALNTYQPTMTKQYLRQTMDLRKFDYYVEKMSEAAQKAMPENNQSQEEKKIQS